MKTVTVREQPKGEDYQHRENALSSLGMDFILQIKRLKGEGKLVSVKFRCKNIIH
jgi:hypothetical protein